MTLSVSQSAVIRSLVSGSTVKDAAAAAGVHRSTVHEWIRRHHEFRAALDFARHSFALQIEDDLNSLSAAATSLIRKVIEDDSVPTALRLRAALAVAKSVGDSDPSRQAVKGSAMTAVEFDRLYDAACRAAGATVSMDRALAEPAPASPAAIPRSSPCPCGSGQKYKRCCSVNAPAVLGERTTQSDTFRHNPAHSSEFEPPHLKTAAGSQTATAAPASYSPLAQRTAS